MFFRGVIFFLLAICVHILTSSVLFFENSKSKHGIKNNPYQSTKNENNVKKIAAGGEPVHWVLLVAGSNGWDNYRHQADICHAYQIVKRHGIPNENIIVMMFDDIANNSENPTKGQIINHPQGADVYHGVIVDYRLKDVTPENFLAILRGDEKKMKNIGSGRVIKSGPNDHIFVNFVDHGAPGLVAFPTSQLYAKDLIATIKKMHEKKQYGQMVIYIEACESGSMFQGLLPENVNVYATTAANAQESSFACYYDDARETYLGDLYSVKWMEDSDAENLNLETLHKQYLIAKKDTNLSHVLQFGDPKISRESLNNFQGEVGFEPDVQNNLPTFSPYLDAVPSENVPLAILYRRLDATNDPKKSELLKAKIRELIKEKGEIESTMKQIAKSVSMITNKKVDHILGANHQLKSHDCYQTVVDIYDKHCFDISQNGYARKSLWKLVNMCEERISANVISNAIIRACKK